MTTHRSRAQSLLRLGMPLAMLGVLAIASGVLYRHLHDYPWHRLGADLAGIGTSAVALAVLATVASYVAMTGYDALALKYVEHRMPYRRYAAASFVATAFGNSLGASAVVGAALRARVYSAWGVPGFAITRIIGFNLVTLGLGSAALTAAGILVAPTRVAQALHIPTAVAVVLAVALVFGVLAYLVWSDPSRRPFAIRDWRIDRPTRGLAIAQLLLSTLEWLLMAAVLYALLPPGLDLAFGTFAVMFVVATTAGLLSNIPGGLGVFESVLLIALGGTVAPVQLVTALVAYRFIYFLAPLVVAAFLLAVLESKREQAWLGDLVLRIGVLTPSVMAFGVAVIGAVLVFTGDTPGDSRAPDLTAFTGSLAGIVLILLARGLHRRLRGALVLSIAILSAVLVAAVDHRAVGGGTAATVMLGLLLLSRNAFRRSTSVFRDPRGWAWSAAVGAIVVCFVWWHDLWWGDQVIGGQTVLAASASGGTPTPIRWGLAVGLVGVLVGGIRLQAPGRATGVADPDELRRAEPILATASQGNASLVWSGDKQLMFSSAGNAFLMYQIEGRSWVVMGDPVGAQDEFDDVMWRFLDTCDAQCGRPVFYSVHADLADFYRRHGLSLVKLGEEATVPLAGEFSLQGKARAKLRSECNAAARAGCVVEVVQPQDVPALLPELRVVSDAWLAERNAREKQFSLGAFDEEYVSRFPVAVARVEGRVVAFATLWVSGAGHEVKVDLMRRLSDAPRTVMSHLFAQAMFWAQDQGYQSFNLGMAPLSGLRTGGAVSFWDRIGHFLWTHGEHFYNFKGLRHFKERFSPEWETRYVASPGGPALPVMLLNVATLVGGGLRGMIAR